MSDMSPLSTLLDGASFRCETLGKAVTPLHGRGWRRELFPSQADKLYVILRGTGWIRLNGKQYELKRGRVFLFPAGALQEGSADPKHPPLHIFMHFMSYTTERLHLLELVPPPPCVEGGTARRITRLSKAMLDESKAGRTASELMVVRYLLEILVAAYRAPAADRPAPDAILKAELPPREDTDRIRALADLVAWIGVHAAEPLTLSDLAQHMHLHPTHFSRVFRRAVGVPPMRFVQQCRLRRAGDLLLSTDDSIAEVADAAGFDDPYYFSRAFKRFTGSAPSTYRDERMSR